MGSQVHCSKLRYSYPSIQFCAHISLKIRGHILWSELFRDSLPFHTSLDENIQMNQQIDMIAHQNYSKLIKKVNEIILDNLD